MIWDVLPWSYAVGLFLAGVAITWFVADRIGRRRTREDTEGFENRLMAVSAELATARVERSKAALERQAIGKDLASASDTIERLRAEADALWQVVTQARDARDEAVRRFELAQRDLVAAHHQVGLTSAEAAQLAASEKERQLLADQKAAALARLVELGSAKNRAEADRTRALLQVETLEQQLRQAVELGRTERERLEANRAMTLTQVRDLKRQIDDALRERGDAAAERDALRGDLANAMGRVADHEGIRRAERVEHQEELARMAAQIGALQAQAERVDPLRRQVADREELLRSVAKERDDATAGLIRRERELLARIEQLERDTVDRNRLAKQLAERDARIGELDARVASLGRERDDRATGERQALAQIESQKSEIKDRDVRFRALLDDRRSFVETNRSEVARLREDLTRAQLRGANGQNGQNGTEVPAANGHHAETDDLKRISGIGPAIERALQRHGINTFRQIATWDDEAIARMARELGAYGSRIKRDRWVEQARLEHERHYGRSVED